MSAFNSSLSLSHLPADPGSHVPKEGIAKAGQMTDWVKVLATNSDDPRSISRTYTKVDTNFTELSSDFCMHSVAQYALPASDINNNNNF